MLELEVWTSEEAKNVSGGIIVPEDCTFRTLTGKNKVQFQVREWWETAVIVGIDEPKIVDDERLGLKRQELRVSLKQAGASFPSENTDVRFPAARFRFWDALRFEKKSKLKEAAERTTTGSKEKALYGTFIEFEINSGRIAKFLTALGYKGKLDGNTNFRGLGSITDILTELTGRQLGVQLRIGDLWSDGNENRIEPVNFRSAE